MCRVGGLGLRDFASLSLLPASAAFDPAFLAAGTDGGSATRLKVFKKQAGRTQAAAGCCYEALVLDEPGANQLVQGLGFGV